MGRVSVAAVTVQPPSIRRARVLGVLYLAVAGLMALVFGAGSPGGAESRLGLNSGTDPLFGLPDIVVPTRAAAFVLAAACAFLGAVQLSRGFGRRANLILGIVAVVFILAFLIWAARGRSLSLIGMLESTVLRAVPLAFGALSGVLCERAGVINIAIEGMLLAAAFTGAVVASVSDSLWLGLAAGALVGGLVAWLLAVLSIRYLVDQIVAGTVINILALGLTAFLTDQFLQRNQELNNPGRFQDIELPILSDVPILGPLIFDNNVFVYLMIVLVVVTHIALFHSRWGLRVRAVGEHPLAADTVGIRVLYTRYRNVFLGGVVAGIGGAYFSLGAVGRFEEGMTAGRGFIGLAAMIFGAWSPLGALGAALVFGFADSLQVKLNILQVGIPSEFLAMAPYIVTIVVVAGVVRRVRPPAADGKPYVKH